jgi:integrase/recombinase XerD
MALEAIQAQAGHASIESTRVYLQVANDCLAGENLRAAEAIEAGPVGAAVSAGDKAVGCQNAATGADP